MNYMEKYSKWMESSYVSKETKDELKNISDEKEIEDRFYRELEFGTGGLRGVIGAGSNRMNVYTVGKATQGLSNYLKAKYIENISVVIAYDSRNMSKEFAEEATRVFCGNGIKVMLFEDLRPTPMASYTVRELKCNAGIVITASHNPKIYNGYKVYGEDGGQITDVAADEILKELEGIDDFSKVRKTEIEGAKENNLLTMIGEDIDKKYLDRVKDLTIREELVKDYASELKVIYTPIHGSGNIPVRRVLRELGYEKVFVVKEQEKPDGNFPTVPKPNPEEPKVFELALAMAKEVDPDIIFGTDPDCDRIGVVVKDNVGEYKVLTGNQTGVLLTHYIVSSLKKTNKLVSNGAIIKTIVTTEMVRKITEEYKVELIDVLTGFKYIGEKIKEFEINKDKTYLFGFEESFGYLAGDFVRDKDAVIAAMLICEMALYYKKEGKNLYEALMGLYSKYGFYKESLVSIELKGKEGQEKIASAMEYLRNSMEPWINNINIVKKMDYKLSIEKDLLTLKESNVDLPKSNVLKFILEDGSWFVIRPSGTEPKMKVYLSVTGDSIEDSNIKSEILSKAVMKIINLACK